MRAGMDLMFGRDPSPKKTARRTPKKDHSRATPVQPDVVIFATPGTYSSPIVDVREVVGRGSDTDERVPIEGIALDLAAHARVWEEWAPHVRRWTQDELNRTRRYHTDNRMFGGVSARLLAGAIGAIRPRRYVEIGSGFTSAVLLDINEEWRADDPIQLTFIDPYSARLESILREHDREACTIIADKVQSVDLGVFDVIEPGDVLFIDSSHVAKSGSDVLRELFEILPRLPVGAYIHVHDIPYPFDYPMKWLVEQNRSWNEAYFLRAFLMYNSAFTVHFWTDFFQRFGADALSDDSRALIGRGATSMWLRRTAQ